MYTYRPSGVCTREIDIELDGDKIKDVSFVGGCDGNLKAIGKLIAGMPVDRVIELLDGNACGMKSTSCADQLAKALAAIEEHEKTIQA